MPNMIAFRELQKETKQLSTDENLAEDLYLSLFDKSHSVMLLIDPNTGDIVAANAAACQYYQYSIQQITKMKILQINTLSSAEVFSEMQKARIENRNYFNFKHKLANGEIRHVEVYSSPISLSNQQFLYSIIHDISERKENERKRLELVSQLEEALDKVKLLTGLLPICARCKKIRKKDGEWNQIEVYIREHSEADFSHGLCPDCAQRILLEFE